MVSCVGLVSTKVGKGFPIYSATKYAHNYSLAVEEFNPEKIGIEAILVPI